MPWRWPSRPRCSRYWGRRVGRRQRALTGQLQSFDDGSEIYANRTVDSAKIRGWCLQVNRSSSNAGNNMYKRPSPAIRGPLPPALLFVAIVLMIVLHVLVPVVQLFIFPWRLVGAAPIAAGLALNVWVDQLFKSAGTAVKPFETSVSLVLQGPFLLSRNPMYLGMAIVLAGIAIGLGSATPWLVIPLFIWQLTVCYVVPEELKLKASFGSEYLQYMAKVRRWL